MELLKIKDLEVVVDNKKIIDGLNLTVKKGEIHVLLGLNGAGKSTLFQAIMGNPAYEINKGSINFKGIDITNLEPDKRAILGIFLSFQSPEEIMGVRLSEFLKTALYEKSKGDEELGIKETKMISLDNFRERLYNEARNLNMKQGLETRYLNIGYSGGEKKKSEILQMMMLNPDLALLDEIDSGLDIEATKDVQKAINRFINQDKSMIVITHHTGIVDGITPDFVHVLDNGKIICTGNSKLIKEVQEKGFEWLKDKNE